MKTLGLWMGIILGVTIGLPALIVLGGGFYNPAIIESIESQDKQLIRGLSIDHYREEEVIQVLAASLSPGAPKEALKTQAVISRTYILRRELGIVEEGELKKMSKDEMETLWGKNYQAYYKNYEQAAKETKGEILLYEGELIEPVYHRESAGKTRTGESMYKMVIPYLQEVDSPYDQITQEKVILKTQFEKKLKTIYPQLLLDAHTLEGQVQIVSRTPSGYIEQMQIGNLLIDGEDLRHYFELPSAAFHLTMEGDVMVFETKGIGHGVGLSQNGAIEMAKEGMDYEEILKHYYKGVEIRIK